MKNLSKGRVCRKCGGHILLGQEFKMVSPAEQPAIGLGLPGMPFSQESVTVHDPCPASLAQAMRDEKVDHQMRKGLK